jgi:large subunit ribosomal protein L29
MMKPHELRALTDAELDKKVADNKEELANLRFQKATTQVTDVAKFGNLRKEIARANTIKRERALNATAAPKS